MPEDDGEWLLDELQEEDYQQCMLALFNSVILPSEPGTPRGRGQDIPRDRMRRPLFVKIMERIVTHDVTFTQRPDATGKMGLSTIQKITVALRMMAYGSAVVSVDEYVRIGESTALLCLTRFCRAIHDLYLQEYLRNPTVEDTQRILAFNQARGFPGMMGSIDCMHWQWRNCPRGWAGVFQGSKGHPTVVLEAIASYDLWIWHAFFGMPGSLNDLNVLDRSDVFQAQVEGVAPRCSFRVNGNEYTQTYLLADGIYPQWASFVKSIKEPQGEKRKHFSKMQEAARKDIERTFGVLQAKWAIIREPARTWNQGTLLLIMKCCIILHNMIVEDERDLTLQDDFPIDLAGIRVERGEIARDTRLPNMHVQELYLRDTEGSHALRHDLVEHLWATRGEE